MDINLESLACKQNFYRRELGLDVLVLLHQGKRTIEGKLSSNSCYFLPTVEDFARSESKENLFSLPNESKSPKGK